MYRRAVYLISQQPNDRDEFLVAVGNHMERWSIDRVKEAVHVDGWDLLPSNPHVGLGPIREALAA